jgi:hypothetical protein
MSSPGTTASEQQPVRVCGACSSDLCAHHVCRVCSDCPECDCDETDARLAREVVDDICVAVDHASPVMRQMRSVYLAKIGIAEADMLDASRAIDELRHDWCICGNRKMPFDSFCRTCFRKLPAGLRPNLNLHLKCGYLPYIRRAWKILAAIRVTEQRNK